MLHKVRHRLRKHSISFHHAAQGVWWVLRTQPNYQVHVLMSILVLVFGMYFSIRHYEWLVLGVLITMGLVIETINSALEQTLDCVSLDRREDIRIAKDAAAGAMLIFATGAALIGISIFIPYAASWWLSY